MHSPPPSNTVHEIPYTLEFPDPWPVVAHPQPIKLAGEFLCLGKLILAIGKLKGMPGGWIIAGGGVTVTYKGGGVPRYVRTNMLEMVRCEDVESLVVQVNRTPRACVRWED